MTNNRLLWIDFLKGFAILGVILVHFNGAINAPSHTLGSMAAIGARCPQLFFIISAYLTWYSISKKEMLNTKNFLKKRFIKIVPLYYLTLIIIALIPTIRHFDCENIVTHVTFVNGFFPLYTNSIMKVEWNIADLAIFYMIVPILYKCIKNLKNATIAFAISLLINILFTITSNFLFKEKIVSSGIYEMYFHTFCFINQIPVLLIGILCFYALRKTKDTNFRWKIYLTSFFITIFTIWLFVFLHLNKTYLTSSLIAGLIFGLILLLFADTQCIKYEGVISLFGKKLWNVLFPYALY